MFGEEGHCFHVVMLGTLFVALLKETVPALVGIVGTLDEGFRVVYFPEKRAEREEEGGRGLGGGGGIESIGRSTELSSTPPRILPPSLPPSYKAIYLKK